MPDWLTHIVLGLILIEIFNVRKKSLVLIGAILPDILPKLVLLRLFIPMPNINYSFLSAFHVPFVLFLFTLLMAPLFRYDYKKVVLWLNLGTMSHFLSDALLKSFGSSGMKLLYPLTITKYKANIVWPEQSYFIFIPAFLIYISILGFKKYRGSQSLNS